MDEVRIEVQFFDNQQARLYHRLNLYYSNAEDVVSRTIDIVFEDTTGDNSSCKNTELNSIM